MLILENSPSCTCVVYPVAPHAFWTGGGRHRVFALDLAEEVYFASLIAIITLESLRRPLQ